MQTKLSLFFAATVLALSGCSQGTDLERALVGAGAGCLAGEIIQEGECLVGAIAGGAAGALADDVNRF